MSIASDFRLVDAVGKEQLTPPGLGWQREESAEQGCADYSDSDCSGLPRIPRSSR